MNKKSTLLVAILLCCFSLLFAQDNAIAIAINKKKIPQKSKFSSIKVDQALLPIWKGWFIGFDYGFTQFDGDVRQYDHYPAFQEIVDFYELKTAFSLSLIKKINPIFSLEGQIINGKFAGLNRSYSNFDSEMGYYDNPYAGLYEGNGEKFETDFVEFDASLIFDITNLSTYFLRSYNKKYSIFGKIGLGYNVYHSLKTNLNNNSYIYSYGYADEGQGQVKKSFGESPSATVKIYGIEAVYPINKRININIELTKRIGATDTWDSSERKTSVLNDSYSSMMLGFSYMLGAKNNDEDWESPIDMLQDDVSSLYVKIDGFTEDSDNDGISDAFDKEYDTPLGVAVDGSGTALDIDMDNIPDYRDSDPFSNRGAQVDINGIELDDDKDGVPNIKDLESNTTIGAMVNQFGIKVGSKTSSYANRLIYLPSIYFSSGSAIVESSNSNRIATIALLLKNNKHIRLKVIGHTDNIGSSNFNRKLGIKRANAVIKYLVINYDIEINRLVPQTNGEENPLSKVTQINDQRYKEGVRILRNINRRVDFNILD